MAWEELLKQQTGNDPKKTARSGNSIWKYGETPQMLSEK